MTIHIEASTWTANPHRRCWLWCFCFGYCCYRRKGRSKKIRISISQISAAFTFNQANIRNCYQGLCVCFGRGWRVEVGGDQVKQPRPFVWSVSAFREHPAQVLLLGINWLHLAILLGKVGEICLGWDGTNRAQELCESRGGRPGLLSLISLWFLWT